MPCYRLFSTLVLLGAASSVQAALLPTEIYYNGPEAGADPDEFVELANTGDRPLALKGYRFAAGLGLSFPDLRLAAGETLIVAPNPSGFLARFAGFAGAVLDASGSLSNSGETLTLVDAADTPVFSFAYDDRGAWPLSADGAGDSLQLLAGTANLADPASWEAAEPRPGFWTGSTPPAGGGDAGASGTVPNPASLWLVAAGLVLLRARRHGAAQYRVAPHILAAS
jgi:hypothetical protein